MFKNLLFLALLALCLSCTENIKTKEPFSSSDSLVKPINLRSDDSVLVKKYQEAYQQNINEIDNFFSRQNTWRGFNGNVLFAIKGVPIFIKSYGFRNLKTKDSLRTHDAFQLASVSKPITATAILQLYEAGKLNLEDTIQKFIPKFPSRYNNITIHQLLSHQSGLFEYDKFNDKIWRKNKAFLTFEMILDAVIEQQPYPYYKPGKRFDYLNFNYVILAEIIEKVSGKSFEEYLQENIFNPAGMKDAFVFDANDSLSLNKKSVFGHLYRRVHPLDYQDGVSGDKGVFASVHDLLAFDQAYYSGVLLNDSTKRLAQSKKVKKWNSHKNYGYGWRLDFSKGKKKIIYHNGWWKGYKSKFIRVEDNELTIIVLSNRLKAMSYSYRDLIKFIDRDQFKLD